MCKSDQCYWCCMHVGQACKQDWHTTPAATRKYLSTGRRQGARKKFQEDDFEKIPYGKRGSHPLNVTRQTSWTNTKTKNLGQWQSQARVKPASCDSSSSRTWSSQISPPFLMEKPALQLANWTPGALICEVCLPQNSASFFWSLLS